MPNYFLFLFQMIKEAIFNFNYIRTDRIATTLGDYPQRRSERSPPKAFVFVFLAVSMICDLFFFFVRARDLSSCTRVGKKKTRETSRLRLPEENQYERRCDGFGVSAGIGVPSVVLALDASQPGASVVVIVGIVIIVIIIIIIINMVFINKNNQEGGTSRCVGDHAFGSGLRVLDSASAAGLWCLRHVC